MKGCLYEAFVEDITSQLRSSSAPAQPLLSAQTSFALKMRMDHRVPSNSGGAFDLKDECEPGVAKEEQLSVQRKLQICRRSPSSLAKKYPWDVGFL